MAIAGIDPKCYILALFVRDDGVRFLLGDDPYEFKDKQLHFQPNTVANDVVEVQGNDGYLLAGQVRRPGTQSFDGYVCNGTNSKAEVEVKRREFLQFFRRSHFYKVIYVFPNGTAIQRKQGFLVDDPTVQELYQQYPEYHVALNFEDVNYYTYEEDDQGQEIYAKEAIVPLAGGGATGGLIWDEYGVVWEDPWSDLVSVSGSEIQIENETGARAPIQDLGLLGDTYQQTYSGKNLFNSYALAGKTFLPASCQMVIGSDGTITLTGNTGSNGYCRVMNTPLRDFCPKLEVGETYYLYLVGENLARNNIYLNSSGSSWDAGTSRTITQSDLDSDIVFYGGYNTTTTIKIMVTKAQDNNYEPYVGGTASPNPDYPQDVQVVTGEQMVTVTGKNLLDVSSLSQAAINVGLVVENGLLSDTSPNDDSRYWNYANCNWTIILSPGVYTLSETFTKRCTNASFGGLRIYTSSGTLLANNYDITDKDHVTNTFTLTETTSIGIMIKIADGECYVQLEKGANATAYEPYHYQPYTIDLGATELCKIGDYQDYIYKSGEDWYVHKEVRHLSLPVSGMNNGEVFPGWTGITELIQDFPAGTNVNMNTLTDSWDNITGINLKDSGRLIWGVINRSSGVIYANRSFFGNAWNQTYWTTNYPNLIIELYYGIVNTPTDTKITDATLVGQLEALGAMRLFIGENNLLVSATGTNLPATLEFSYPTKFAKIGAEWEEGGTKGATIVNVNAIDNTYPVWELMGPAVNPTISVLTTNTTLTYNGTITASQKLVIDMFNKTATLNGTSVIGNVSGDFVYMAPGTNRIAYTAENTDAPDSTIYWQEVVG